MSDETQDGTQEPNLLRYIRAIGHDVGAPIRHVRGFSDLLQDEIGDSLADEAKLLLNQIQTSAELAERMIYGIHDVALLGSRLNIQHTPSLQQIVQNALDQLAEPGLQLAVEGDCAVRTDPRLLARLLVNIMRNTHSYAKRPELAIDIELQAGRPTIRLADQGPAFAQKEWPNALAPFRRLHARPNATALGLGLTEVAHIANLLNITLTAAASPGKSLAITLQFPSK